MNEKCAKCSRGREACEWCEGTAQLDWQTICDCGLYDLGAHLLDCRERADFKYVVASDYASAEIRRG